MADPGSQTKEKENGPTDVHLIAELGVKNNGQRDSFRPGARPRGRDEFELAAIYSALGDRDHTIAGLEKGLPGTNSDALMQPHHRRLGRCERQVLLASVILVFCGCQLEPTAFHESNHFLAARFIRLSPSGRSLAVNSTLIVPRIAIERRERSGGCRQRHNSNCESRIGFRDRLNKWEILRTQARAG